MAVTQPPPPPSPAQPPLPPPRRVRRSSTVARAIPLVALAIVVLIIAFLIFGGSGKTTYYLMFPEADQLVKGNTVQVGGVPVGSVTNIELTKDFKARVTIVIENSLAPLHLGTVAQVRVPSLSSVANRYIALEPGPNNFPKYPPGSTLPATATRAVTDLDQLFNALDPRTRRGLQQFIQGTAEQYEGAGKALGESTEYFAPALNSIDHVFSELIRDQPVFTHFLIETAKAVTTLAARKEALSGLIEHSNKTFEAIGSEQQSFAEGLKQLPLTLHQGNVTFAEVPATTAALEELIIASKPGTKPLTTLLEKLRPLLTTATPVVRNFRLAINRPGPDNDLTELAQALPALAHALASSSPATVTSLKESVPITAFFGPYAPDLAGTFRSFGQAGSFYDADGHYAHVTPVLPDFKLESNGTLAPTSSEKALEGLKTGQLRRCPGAASEPASDGSSPFVDGGLLTCIPTELP